ncbi:MAG: hypothetical protein J6Y02_02155 [Pseudobutyrivibrio sp.]|nr:hypothetical protein [Pseudobutyrivibrio sp.]
MATSIVPELSKTNPYYISKHRYYELKHFCLQYPEWQREIRELNSKAIGTTSMIFKRREKRLEDKVSEIAIQILSREEKMRKVDQIINSLEPLIRNYIFLAVTQGRSFTYLSTVLDMPCCRDTYYERYRRFFYLLARE